MFRYAFCLVGLGALLCSIGPVGQAAESPPPLLPPTEHVAEGHPLVAIEQAAAQQWRKSRLSATAADKICQQYHHQMVAYLQKQQVLSKAYHRPATAALSDFYIEILPQGETLLNKFAAKLQTWGFKLILRSRLALAHLVPHHKLHLLNFHQHAFYFRGTFLVNLAENLRAPQTQAAVAMLKIFKSLPDNYLFTTALRLDRSDHHQADLYFIDRDAKIFLAPPAAVYPQLDNYLADTLALTAAVHQAGQVAPTNPAQKAALLRQARGTFYNSVYLLGHTVLALNLFVYTILHHPDPYQINTRHQLTEVHLNPAGGVKLNLDLPRPCWAVDHTFLPSVLREEKFQKLYLYLTQLLTGLHRIHHQINILPALTAAELNSLAGQMQDLAFLPTKVKAGGPTFISYWQQNYRDFQKYASARIKDYHKYMGQHPCKDPLLPPRRPTALNPQKEC